MQNNIQILEKTKVKYLNLTIGFAPLTLMVEFTAKEVETGNYNHPDDNCQELDTKIEVAQIVNTYLVLDDVNQLLLYNDKMGQAIIENIETTLNDNPELFHED